MIKTVTAGMITLAAISSAIACMHPPATYKGSWEETSQQAVIFYRQGHEDLVLKVGYKFSPKDGLPSSFGWVIPVPNKPDAYDVTDAGVFADAFDLTQHYRDNPKGARSGSLEHSAPAGATKVVDHQVVGEFDITAIEATGNDAATALNKWLTNNGFNAMPATDLKYYTNLSWTFLAVKVDHEKGSTEIAKTGDLHALRISFATDDIIYPLKLSAKEGAFDVTTYVLSEKPLEIPNWLDDRGFIIQTFDKQTAQRGSIKVTADTVFSDNTKALAKLRAQVEGGKTGKFEALYLTSFVAAGINDSNNKVANWRTDFVVREAVK